MAHVDLPEEELRPLIASLERVLRPIIDLAPAVTMVPSELDRIGNKLEDDMMSGMPERLEAVHEKVTMDLGGKILAMQEKAADRFGTRQLKIQTDLENQRNEKISQALINSSEFGDKMAAQRQERLEQQLVNLQERGLAAEIKGQRVQFLSQKDLEAKQKENLKTQKLILKKEQELQKLIKKGEEGSEDKISQLINELGQLSETEGQQSKVLGDKKKTPGTVRGIAEDFLPAPILGAFDEFASNITEVGKTVLSFGKPFMALGKVVDKRLGITEKLQKLEVKKFALAVKEFAIAKLKFALDMLSVLTNPYALIAAAIAAAVAAIYLFKDEIYNFVAGIGESISNFGKSIYNAFANSAIGKFFGMEAYDMPAKEETSASTSGRNRKSPLATEPKENVLQNIAPETADDKLSRLKSEASQMEREKIASTVVNAFADNTTQTSVAVNPTVPKATSDDALALNSA